METRASYALNIPCYHPKSIKVASIQLHGFSDASEKAYSSVVYLRMEDTNGIVHTSLVTSKTRVAPIKPLTIPRLELNGALMLFHCKEVLRIVLSSVYAWTDSTGVLACIQGNPRRFKVYVANTVAQIMDLIAAGHWKHVSEENPADCASRGMYPSEFLHHDLWWHRPTWMKLPPSDWHKSNTVSTDVEQDQSSELSTTFCNKAVVKEPLIPIDKLSSFNLYKRVTAWVIRFIHNCRAKVQGPQPNHGPLGTQELKRAARYWYLIMQEAHFTSELRVVKSKTSRIPTSKQGSLTQPNDRRAWNSKSWR